MLALLVAACAPERTEPSEPGIASGATAHVTAVVPNMEQTLYDIVDETGATIWQPYSAEPPTEASFTLSVYGNPCVIATLAELGSDWPGFDRVNCFPQPAPGWTTDLLGLTYDSDGNPVLPSVLENCISQRGQYPFAMVTNDVTCWILGSVYSSAFFPTPIGLEAAPTAPGNRVFKRWEVTGGNGDPLSCEQGQASLQCSFIARFPEDWEGHYLNLFIKLHYGPPGYDFSGFFRPVDNLPTQNTMRAGRAVPITFSLGGDRGLNVLAADSPSSRRVDCSSAAPLDAIEETVTAGESSLTYDAASGEYTYVWKTERAWAGTCRDFTLALNDGSAPKTVRFKF
ncbi:MAG TPA: PxKF domain-containing protein [Gemmatimonadales bacterium]|nr:PxKF domain-containing protein [Gemmatimonadales bacterium]